MCGTKCPASDEAIQAREATSDCLGTGGLYPREVYPDQPPRRATIHENQAKLPDR